MRKCRACAKQEHPRDHEGSGQFVHKKIPMKIEWLNRPISGREIIQSFRASRRPYRAGVRVPTPMFKARGRPVELPNRAWESPAGFARLELLITPGPALQLITNFQPPNGVGARSLSATVCPPRPVCRSAPHTGAANRPHRTADPPRGRSRDRQSAPARGGSSGNRPDCLGRSIAQPLDTDKPAGCVKACHLLLVTARIPYRVVVA